MNDEQLRTRLEELHLALLQMIPDDKTLEIKRDALAAHIRQALDDNDWNGDDLQRFHVTLREMLQEQLVSFEEKHPKVTMLINSITEMFNSLGI